MIVEGVAGQPDWFRVDDETLRSVAHAPGLQWNRNEWLIHRTHLPLLGHPAPDVAPPTPKRVAQVVKAIGLRDYQADDLAWLAKRRSALLGHQPRLGKTASAVGAAPDEGAVVVIAPLAVRDHWIDWFARRWPDQPVRELRGIRADVDLIRGARLFFCHYEIAAAWGMALGSTLGRVEYLVLDEAHWLANPKSKRTRSVTALTGWANQIVAVTGTPLWNKPASAWSVLNAICPGGWGSFSEFTAAYCDGQPGPRGWVTGGPTRTNELLSRLSEVLRALRWEDVQAELPPITTTVETVEIDRKAESALDDAAAALRAGSANPTEVGELARARRLLGSVKAKHAAALAKEVLDGGEPVVVWVWHREVADEVAAHLEKLGHPAGVVTGDNNVDVRNRVMASWRKSQVPTALVIGLTVGQVGIDLSHAAYAIFCELDWTPAVITQAAMRTFSPKRPCFETYLVADHDVDRHLAALVMQKQGYGDQMGLRASDRPLRLGGKGQPSETGDMNALLASLQEMLA